MDGEDQVAFNTRTTDSFNMMYDAGMIAVSDTGITVPTVPDNCDDSSKQAVADLANSVADLERKLTQRDWAQANVDRACDEQKALIDQTIADVEQRITDSENRADSIILELFQLGKTDGETSLSNFDTTQRTEFDMEMRPNADTGVELITVPDRCPEENKQAANMLTILNNSLGRVLAF